ncbi:MAG: Stf0 family sulfotransferase [Xenococcaceae cyanobacterium]
MEIATIFNNLAEINFLEKLAQEKNLIFIGETDTINYLQTCLAKINPLNSNYYFLANTKLKQDLTNNRDRLDDRDAIIIASATNENVLNRELQKLLTELKINLPLLRLFADVFVNLMLNRHLLDISKYQINSPKISYAILTTPRSGSTFLCATLQSTQIAGFPTEHLRQPSAVLSQYCGFDYLRYLQAIKNFKVTSNEVFGTKIISHFLQVFEKDRSNFETVCQKEFSKFIYLIRRDKIAQAVSIFLAQKTDVWHICSEQQCKNYAERLKQINFKDSHLEEIHQNYLFLRKQEAYLEKLIETYKIFPLVMEYEKLVENTEEEINKALKYLGIIDDRDRVKNISSHVKKLPSNLSVKLVRAYQEKYL